MAIKLQIRRGTASNWTSANPTLLSGEIGYETDTGNIKIGDGTTNWVGLSYNVSTFPQSSVSGTDFNAAGFRLQGRYSISTSVSTNKPTEWVAASDAPAILLTTAISGGSCSQVLFSTKSIKVYQRSWDGTSYTSWISLSSVYAFNVSADAIATAAIQDNAVTNAKLRDSTAASVIGRSAGTAGDPADIVAGTDGHVLRRSSGTLGFGQIAAASIPTNTIPYDRLSNATQTTLLGATAAGAISEFTVRQIRNLCGFQLIPLSWLGNNTVNITTPGTAVQSWIGWVLRTEYNLNPGDGFVMRPIRGGADITGGQTSFPVDIDGGTGTTANTGGFYRQGVSIWLRVI